MCVSVCVLACVCVLVCVCLARVELVQICDFNLSSKNVKLIAFELLGEQIRAQLFRAFRIFMK